MFDKFIMHEQGWLSGDTTESSIVFSSRVRIARNLKGHLFPEKSRVQGKCKVLDNVEKVFSDVPAFSGMSFLKMDEVPDIDKLFLVERHLISREHSGDCIGKGLILADNETVSIMINEEDHLRMQLISPGFKLKNSWTKLSGIDDELGEKLDFAFSQELGYITSCPTNVGTALRASCMLHLPGLVLTKRITKILEFLAKISFITRGLFGEGTHALGDFFQISNQVTLGVTESEVIDNLESIVRQIYAQEIQARNILMKRDNINVSDNAWRALGILRYSRLITTKEALGCLSMLSLGIDLGIIKDVDFPGCQDIRRLVNNLFVLIQPAHLQKIEDRTLKENERDFIRADLLRKALN